MRAWIVTIVALLTVIGVGIPRFAGRSGHLLLITIGLVVAVVAVHPAFAAIEQRRAQPFVPTPPRTPRATMPNQMSEIVDAFTKRRGSDDLAELVPPLLIHRITTAATGRIVDHHHLHLADIDDHPAIRALVSPTMWALLRPAESAARSAPSVPVLPFADLDRLLDELERL
jgi:hypothetical protein